ARAAFDWAVANAADLGSDPTRIAVGGDSAGGNLAAVVAMDTARSLSPPPIAQLLFYPITDAVEKHPSRGLFGTGFLLTSDLMDWFAQQYEGGNESSADPANPRISPLRAQDHSGLAPAIVITAGFDPLRDEGEAYARQLDASGVEVVQRRFPDLIHGFINMPGVSRAARDALLETCGVLRSVVRR
ncbi:MAG: alpha/beta hydrolase, partial [Actinomycetes bacterium]